MLLSARLQTQNRPQSSGHKKTRPTSWDRFFCVEHETRFELATLDLGEGHGLRSLDERVAASDPVALRGLRLKLNRLFYEIARNPTALGSAALGHELASEIQTQIVATLASSSDARRAPPSRTRDLAQRRALSFIADRADEPLTVRELCQASGVSERTLQYAFREYFGVTPKAYLTAIRLNGARRELRDAGSDTVIADVANRSDFWHMGGFAADYRRFFGELPSQTLRSEVMRA
jgi:AraC family ethanolamine operon transcriptional activator